MEAAAVMKTPCSLRIINYSLAKVWLDTTPSLVFQICSGRASVRRPKRAGDRPGPNRIHVGVRLADEKAAHLGSVFVVGRTAHFTGRKDAL
jgi:hypothetical protein